MCAKLAANKVRVYLDEFDVSGVVNSTSMAIKQETAKTDCLSSTGPARVVGNYDHTGENTGFFDGADDGYDEQAFSNWRTDEDHYRTTTYGTAAGSLSYDEVCRLVEEPRSSAVGGAVLLNIKVEGSGALARGMILRTGAITGNGNGTGQNQGATTAPTMYAVTFRVLSVSGAGSFVLTIEESANDGTPDTYATVTGLTDTFTAVGVSRKTTVATTEAWKRVVVSGWSGFTSATILVTAGSVAGT